MIPMWRIEVGSFYNIFYFGLTLYDTIPTFNDLEKKSFENIVVEG